MYSGRGPTFRKIRQLRAPNDWIFYLRVTPWVSKMVAKIPDLIFQITKASYSIEVSGRADAFPVLHRVENERSVRELNQNQDFIGFPHFKVTPWVSKMIAKIPYSTGWT